MLRTKQKLHYVTLKLNKFFADAVIYILKDSLASAYLI